MHELAWNVELPNGHSTRTRFQHAVAYESPTDHRWLISSTHTTEAAARRVAADPLTTTDGRTITRIALTGTPATTSDSQ